MQGEKKVKEVHYVVGKKVWKAITDIGRMMPEEMPTQKKSKRAWKRKEKVRK